jgi:hypothetical protein
MSTEIGIVRDCLRQEDSIEIAIGTGGIRLFSTQNKIWLDDEGVSELIELLEVAKLRLYKSGD